MDDPWNRLWDAVGLGTQYFYPSALPENAELDTYLDASAPETSEMAASAALGAAGAQGSVFSQGHDLIRATTTYVARMLGQVRGMKALVMDETTTGVISSVMYQSDILAREVYLIERLGVRVESDEAAGDSSDASVAAASAMQRTLMKHDDVGHLNAVFFIRPTQRNLDLLAQHLRKPIYAEYHVFFSNRVSTDQLRALAELDTFEVVRQVQEFYADYFPVNRDVFDLGLDASFNIYSDPWRRDDKAMFDRNLDGLVAAIASCKRCPNIRYSKHSKLGRKLAHDLHRVMDSERELFSYGIAAARPVVLILDRRDDPVTPLLTQWTYQAMVHQLVGIHNNRVDLSAVPNIRPDLREIVMSIANDPFYERLKGVSYGDIGGEVKQLVAVFREKTSYTQKMDSLDDMKHFMENYPEFQKQSTHVSKHTTLLSEVDRLVNTRHLMDIGVEEQNLVCGPENHTKALEAVLEVINNARYHDDDKLRLVLLFALRYEARKSDLATLRALLRDKAQTDHARERVRVVDRVVRFCGAQKRSASGFDLFAATQGIGSRLKRSMVGVENAFFQHTPAFGAPLDALLRGKLAAADFPSVDGNYHKQPPNEVIVYIVGGATYEEAVLVNTLNETRSGVRVLLGGSRMHNSKTFLDDIEAMEADSVLDISYR